MPDRPPNIVYLMSDQQKASAASFLGNPHVPSPFMDEMARDGVAFENAYVPSAICTPSRVSVHTGVHPLVHQVTCHQNRAPWNLPQLAELLKDRGYYCAVAGHYESNRNLCRGWHEESPVTERGPIYNARYQRMMSGKGGPGWSAGGLDCDAEAGHASCITDRVIRMIDAAKATGAPFFLHVCYDDPHPPYFVPRPYDTLVDPDALPLPLRDDAGRPPWQFRCMEEHRTDEATDADVRRAMAVYYGQIAYVDAQMRRVWDALAARGLLENTWLVIGSDHGDYTGEKGLFAKSESLYECLLHVPLILRAPEGEDFARGMRVPHLVDAVDLFPTLLGLVGADVPEYAQGFDLIPWLASGAREPLRDAVFAQVGGYHGYLKNTLPSAMPLSGRHPSVLQGVRTADFSYTRDPDYGDEAYDLRADPRELRNLLNDGAAGPPELDDLRRRLDAHETDCLRLRESLGVVPGDRGFVEGWE